LPLVVVTGVDDDGARRLEDAVPALIGLVAGDTVEPVTETIQGRKIRSLPATALPWRGPLHYGRSGTALVIGPDRKLVAAALARELTQSLPAEPRVAAALQGHADAAVLACLQWEPLLALALAKPVDPKAKKDDAAEDQALKAMRDAADKLPPLVLSVRRQGGD